MLLLRNLQTGKEHHFDVGSAFQSNFNRLNYSIGFMANNRDIMLAPSPGVPNEVTRFFNVDGTETKVQRAIPEEFGVFHTPEIAFVVEHMQRFPDGSNETRYRKIRVSPMDRRRPYGEN